MVSIVFLYFLDTYRHLTMSITIEMYTVTQASPEPESAPSMCTPYMKLWSQTLMAHLLDPQAEASGGTGDTGNTGDTGGTGGTGAKL